MGSSIVTPWQRGFCVGQRRAPEHYPAPSAHTATAIAQPYTFCIDTQPQHPTAFDVALLTAAPSFASGADFRPSCRQRLVQYFDQAAYHAHQHGYPAALIEADEDSAMHALLSPRTSPLTTEVDRISLLVSICQAVKKHCPIWGVALLAEELCPGGLDPLAAQQIALAVQEAGSHFLIASAGTRDFPALKWRRSTGKKQQDPSRNQQTPPVWLASSLWLRTLPQLQIPLLAQSPQRTISAATATQAQQLNLQGVVVWI
ncbi:MAG: hypothetical protein AAF310_05500 [Myxococcota bacterium]